MAEFRELTDDELDKVSGGNFNNFVSCMNMNGAPGTPALVSLMNAASSGNEQAVRDILDKNKNLLQLDALKACSQYLL